MGDIRLTLARLNHALEPDQGTSHKEKIKKTDKAGWLKDCTAKKSAWQALKQQRLQNPTLKDDYWGRIVLTQPAVIKIATDWARQRDAVCFFDAGDVQANAFQVIEDERPGQSFTESGASYMGFAVSALLATGVASKKFFGLALTGDGSFTMNPQILIDGAEYGAHGSILLLDNGRMGAITGLQNDQYGEGFATWNTIHIDYLGWARSIPGVLALDGGDSTKSLIDALDKASKHPGLSLIHVPVYFGPDPLGGMGVYGRWNVGNWCDDVQALRHKIGL
jgi:3D-(3,5/4)-trihydroxycyclohexane-1,2-dione acylhydrolase (decyclizing)